MKKRKKLKLVSLAVSLMLLCSTAVLAGSVPDTGGPNERTCKPHSYTDLGNGIIRDNVTGLMWQQDSAPAPPFYDTNTAITYCRSLTLGGYTDWRLPTITELSNLLDSSIAFPGPVINTTYFQCTSMRYMSSTTDASDKDNIWVVDFYTGAVLPGWANALSVRAVRSGQ